MKTFIRQMQSSHCVPGGELKARDRKNDSTAPAFRGLVLARGRWGPEEGEVIVLVIYSNNEKYCKVQTSASKAEYRIHIM